jgi:hypothetical protein
MRPASGASKAASLERPRQQQRRVRLPGASGQGGSARGLVIVVPPDIMSDREAPLYEKSGCLTRPREAEFIRVLIGREEFFPNKALPVSSRLNGFRMGRLTDAVRH